MSLSEEVKGYALEMGADLAGIASTSEFDDAPIGHRPRDLLTDAKSVIVVAKKIPLSVVKTIPSPLYSTTYRILNEELRVLTYKISLFLEKQGYIALPIDPGISDFARDVDIIQEKPEPKIKMLGDFSHRHAAVKAGLAQFGLASYVVTKLYGPRIRFASLLCNAYLEPDEMIEEGSICNPESCGYACVRACPPGALRGDGTIDHYKCRNYREPELFTLEYFNDISELSKKESNLIRRISILSKKYSSRNSETCGICIKACPIGISIKKLNTRAR